MATELTAEQKAKDARAEKVAWLIIVAIIATLGGGFLALGLAGVGLVAVGMVPVIYLLLIIMAGGKG
ncbi:hypothetical protein SAMN04488030_1983 [Aliiroseovarius halocynthiae]|uniref:Uncharacterized protein n=1 Tax=Aliiroseovarius halocynthiae TaxID=985055 RepID=A0A545SRA1_9RHOB|nr:hypothetical protein [Aliiroseovarius halocynthiae]TQV67503.1 hypothetical protein FIL88_09780 [Aliiroseovarius halocynthiae]SMR81513.1 hypothetical protein SAMN04488030_1983 [Aliiroseovarius halocynthiae]